MNTYMFIFGDNVLSIQATDVMTAINIVDKDWYSLNDYSDSIEIKQVTGGHYEADEEDEHCPSCNCVY